MLKLFVNVYVCVKACMHDQEHIATVSITSVA